MASQREKRLDSSIDVAVVQMEPRLGEKEANLSRSVILSRQAAARGARLIVLPELCTSGYAFETRPEAWALAESITGPTCKAWASLAEELGVYIVGGFVERDGSRLYNTAVLIGPEGFIGSYRKTHLWHEEKLFFEPGDMGFPVYRTPIGRVAMLICYDGWFPEAYRLCALQGADIACLPTNWTTTFPSPPGEQPMARYVTMVSARLNSIFIAAADRVGFERGVQFLGKSLIVGPSGWPVGEAASGDEEEIVVARCDLLDSRRAKRLGELNGRLSDRRIDLYDSMLGSKHGLSPF